MATAYEVEPDRLIEKAADDLKSKIKSLNYIILFFDIRSKNNSAQSGQK